MNSYRFVKKSTIVTYAKHLPEVRVSKPEGDVGHMKSLGLGLAVRALRYRLCWRLTVRLGGVLCLLGNKTKTRHTN